MAGRFWRRSTVGVHEQLAAMRLRWPQFECSVTGGLLVCVGDIQPRPINDVYTARITYRAGWYPRTSILRPKLRCRHPDQRIAHTYTDTELCLFTRSDGDWTSDMLIATTECGWVEASYRRSVIKAVGALRTLDDGGFYFRFGGRGSVGCWVL
jgi:hypothetical protein